MATGVGSPQLEDVIDPEPPAGAERQPVPARGGVPEPAEGLAHGARSRVGTEETHLEG